MAQWQRPLAGRLPPRVRTLSAAQNFRCLPWGISFKKKGEQNDQKKILEHAEELCIFVLRRRNGPITKLQAPPWTRMVPEKQY